MRLLEKTSTRTIFDKITEGSYIPNMSDKDFRDLVLRDFRLFLMDKYNDELYKDVTEDDVNEYFTGMFYDIIDSDDLDSANAAEDIIRAEYHLSDSKSDDYEYDDGDTNWAAEEEADAIERMERRYGGIDESVKPLNEGGIYPVEIDEEANQALVNKLAEILGCDSSEDISIDGLELIPAKGFGGGGQYWFRAQVNIGQAGAYHEDFIWKALEAVKDQCPHLYKVYENGTQSGPGSAITGETNGLEVNYYSTIDIKDDEEVSNGLSFEYSDEDLEIAGCDLKTLEAEETPVGDYLCNLVKEHMSELIELLKSYEISDDDYEETDDMEEYNESVKLDEAKKPKKEKKEDKRVVMQQGNVTCIKENESYLVFENESDNEVEHDSEESAMQDFMERVGIDANSELKEN